MKSIELSHHSQYRLKFIPVVEFFKKTGLFTFETYLNKDKTFCDVKISFLNSETIETINNNPSNYIINDNEIIINIDKYKDSISIINNALEKLLKKEYIDKTEYEEYIKITKYLDVNFLYKTEAFETCNICKEDYLNSLLIETQKIIDRITGYMNSNKLYYDSKETHISYLLCDLYLLRKKINNKIDKQSVLDTNNFINALDMINESCRLNKRDMLFVDRLKIDAYIEEENSYETSGYYLHQNSSGLRHYEIYKRLGDWNSNLTINYLRSHFEGKLTLDSKDFIDAQNDLNKSKKSYKMSRYKHQLDSYTLYKMGYCNYSIYLINGFDYEYSLQEMTKNFEDVFKRYPSEASYRDIMNVLESFECIDHLSSNIKTKKQLLYLYLTHDILLEKLKNQKIFGIINIDLNERIDEVVKRLQKKFN